MDDHPDAPSRDAGDVDAPVDGAHLELTAGRTRATVCTLGAALVDLVVDGVHVVVPGPPGPCRPEEFRGVVLAPWPNRTPPRYEVDGRVLELAVTEPSTGAALHGLVHDRVWQVVDRTASSATLRIVLGDDPGYPFAVEVTAVVEAIGEADGEGRSGGCRGELTARNVGDDRAPVGLGVHPYLSPGAAVDSVELLVPADSVLDVDSRGVPTVPPRPVTGGPLDHRDGRRIGSAELDHAFVGLRRDPDGGIRAELRGPDRTVALWAGPTTECVMVFTSDALPPPSRRAAIAIEPMTCPPGAFATGDAALLESGRDLRLPWAIAVSSSA